jgi:hypothetical protein
VLCRGVSRRFASCLSTACAPSAQPRFWPTRQHLSFSVALTHQAWSYASAAVQALLSCLLAAMAFSLTLFDRSDRVYLWMEAVFLAEAASAAEVVFAVWNQRLSAPADRIFGDLITSLIYAGWVR